MSCEFENWITWISDVCNSTYKYIICTGITLYISRLGFIGTQVLLTGLDCHWCAGKYTEDFNCRYNTICDVRTIFSVLTCRTTLLPPQPTLHMRWIMQYYITTVLWLIMSGYSNGVLTWQNHMPAIWLVVQDPGLSSQQKQEMAWSVPHPFPHEGVESGDETTTFMV